MANEKLPSHADNATLILDDAVSLLDTNDRGNAEEAALLLKVAEIHALLAIKDELVELNQRPYGS